MKRLVVGTGPQAACSLIDPEDQFMMPLFPLLGFSRVYYYTVLSEGAIGRIRRPVCSIPYCSWHGAFSKLALPNSPGNRNEGLVTGNSGFETIYVHAAHPRPGFSILDPKQLVIFEAFMRRSFLVPMSFTR